MTKPKPPSKAPPPRLSSSSSSVDIDGSMDLLHPSSIIQDPALAEALSSVLSNVTYREEEATPKNSNRKTSSATDDKPLTTDSNSNSNSNSNSTGPMSPPPIPNRGTAVESENFEVVSQHSQSNSHGSSNTASIAAASATAGAMGDFNVADAASRRGTFDVTYAVLANAQTTLREGNTISDMDIPQSKSNVSAICSRSHTSGKSSTHNNNDAAENSTRSNNDAGKATEAAEKSQTNTGHSRQDYETLENIEIVNSASNMSGHEITNNPSSITSRSISVSITHSTTCETEDDYNDDDGESSVPSIPSNYHNEILDGSGSANGSKSGKVTASAHLQAHLALEAIRQHQLQQQLESGDAVGSIYSHTGRDDDGAHDHDHDDVERQQQKLQQQQYDIVYNDDDISSLNNDSQYYHYQQQQLHNMGQGQEVDLLSPVSQATTVQSQDPYAKSREFFKEQHPGDEEQPAGVTGAFPTSPGGGGGKHIIRDDDKDMDMDMELYQLQKRQRKRNILIVIMLMTFLAIVSAIGAGVGVAMSKSGEREEGLDSVSSAGDGDAAVGDQNASVDDSGSNNGEESGGTEGKGREDDSGTDNTSEGNSKDNYTIADNVDGNSTDMINATEPDEIEAMLPTASPTESPSMSPTICIPIEVGIIFDEYAGETSWKVLRGAHRKQPIRRGFNDDGNSTAEEVEGKVASAADDQQGITAQEQETTVWESIYYNPNNFNSRADTFNQCLPPGTYTFVFSDREADGICCNHGEGVYLLSTEGKVVTIGGEMYTKERRYVFDLPFEEPEAVDENDDGLDDRTGWVMPFDSSKYIEGETCENFHLELKTDAYGLETTWALFEGSDESGRMFASGGPYASDAVYEVDYCLPSEQEYVLYVYDWAREGICCESGNGGYNVTSGGHVIFESTGVFDDKEITQFYLPLADLPSSSPSEAPARSQMSATTFPTISPTPETSTPGEIREGPGSSFPTTLVPTASPSPASSTIDENA